MQPFSSEEMAFLEEIAENPDDGLLYQIYADWLEEQGDPRSEHIRMQNLLADCSYEDSEERTALKKRVQELEERYRSVWILPLQQFAKVRKVQFERGVMTGFRVRADQFLHTGPIFEMFPTIRTVSLFDVNELGTTQLANCQHLKFVRELDLGGNRLGEWFFTTFIRSPHLRETLSLSLSNCDLTDPCVETLFQQPHLKQFEKLVLNTNRISGKSVAMIAKSEKSRTLKFLGLSNVDLQEDGVQPLADSSCLENLEFLHLEWTRIRSKDLMKLVNSPVVSKLRELNLKHLVQGVRTIEAIASSPYLENLQSLHVSQSRFNASQQTLSYQPLIDRFGAALHIHR